MFEDNGTLIQLLEKKSEVRRIKIKSLSADKNMAQLAADIVEKCPKYIHPSRTEEVEQLLIKLRRYALEVGQQQQSEAAKQNLASASMDSEDDRGSQVQQGRKGNANEGKSDRKSSGRERQSPVTADEYGGSHANYGGRGNGNSQQQQSFDREPRPDPLPPARMSEIDEYLEMLYQVSGKSEKEREETLRLQERGTGMILKLCRDVMNLEQLIQNGTVMGALTRVLSEEFKKSLDLTFNILRFAFFDICDCFLSLIVLQIVHIHQNISRLFKFQRNAQFDG
jgi:hypothetical protein